jgi:mannosyl-oligosaccharide alpha-1,2-mannosidase
MLTKNEQWSYAGFQAIANTTRVGSGYSAINDVNAPNGGGFSDFQESFFFAEVLKYAYLIHTDLDAEYQVAGQEGKNTWVFNTEAHPFMVSGWNNSLPLEWSRPLGWNVGFGEI